MAYSTFNTHWERYHPMTNENRKLQGLNAAQLYPCPDRACPFTALTAESVRKHEESVHAELNLENEKEKQERIRRRDKGRRRVKKTKVVLPKANASKEGQGHTSGAEDEEEES